jgi:hypothetical protein
MPLTARRVVRMAAAERPLRPAVASTDVAFHAMSAAFEKLAARLPVPTPYSRPPARTRATSPDELADQFEAEEDDPYGAAVQLAAIAEELGDLPMRQLAGRAGAILVKRGRGA